MQWFHEFFFNILAESVKILVYVYEKVAPHLIWPLKNLRYSNPMSNIKGGFY